MTDPQALAVAFPENLEAKITNIHRRYSGYLISLKIRISKFKSRVLSAILFQNNLKIMFLIKVKTPTMDLCVCDSIPRES